MINRCLNIVSKWSSLFSVKLRESSLTAQTAAPVTPGGETTAAFYEATTFNCSSIKDSAFSTSLYPLHSLYTPPGRVASM